MNIATKLMKQINCFIKKFKKIFKIKNLKKINKIFDIKIIRDRQNQIFRMNQSHYFIDVFAQFNINVDKHKFTQFSMNEYKLFWFVELNNRRINQKNYKNAIKNIIYATIYTRLNIAFAIEKFNQYLNDFAKYHEQIFKHFLRYIRFIINKNITYENNENHKFVKYFDFDYVVNKLNWKFVLTYVYTIVKNSIF